jgi:hypothetical protein
LGIRVLPTHKIARGSSKLTALTLGQAASIQVSVSKIKGHTYSTSLTQSVVVHHIRLIDQWANITLVDWSPGLVLMGRGLPAVTRLDFRDFDRCPISITMAEQSGNRITISHGRDRGAMLRPHERCCELGGWTVLPCSQASHGTNARGTQSGSRSSVPSHGVLHVRGMSPEFSLHVPGCRLQGCRHSRTPHVRAVQAFVPRISASQVCLGK